MALAGSQRARLRVEEFIFTFVKKEEQQVCRGADGSIFLDFSPEVFLPLLHRDRSNVGPSFIPAFGSFSGGSLRGSNASPSRSSWTTSTLGVELQGHNVLA